MLLILLKGWLRCVLGEAKDMEDSRLHTTVIGNPYDDEDVYDTYRPPELLVPLQSIVPVEGWQKLRQTWHSLLEDVHIAM